MGKPKSSSDLAIETALTYDQKYREYTIVNKLIFISTVFLRYESKFIISLPFVHLWITVIHINIVKQYVETFTPKKRESRSVLSVKEILAIKLIR